MSDQFTPSEQRVWDAAYGSAWIDSFGWSEESQRVAFAIREANEAVFALRAHRTARGAWVGASLPGGEVKADG